jgi:hypothetical protein
MNQDIRPGPPRCRVVAAGTVTTYEVVGRGQVVLVLTDDSRARERLLTRLSSTNRVVAPDHMALPVGVDAELWLASFVEALGLSQVRIIADVVYETAARSLTLTDPDRVESLVALRDAED